MLLLVVHDSKLKIVGFLPVAQTKQDIWRREFFHYHFIGKTITVENNQQIIRQSKQL